MKRNRKFGCYVLEVCSRSSFFGESLLRPSCLPSIVQNNPDRRFADGQAERGYEFTREAMMR